MSLDSAPPVVVDPTDFGSGSEAPAIGRRARTSRFASIFVPRILLLAGAVFLAFFAPACGSDSGLSSATQVSAGWGYTCALISNGKIRCSGNNDNGQLGNGSILESSDSTEVKGISNAGAVDTGSGHACAVLSNGTVQCWGSNGEGQLGDGLPNHGLRDPGSGDISPTPVKVSAITDATEVTVGDGQTCVILSNHRVECWGANESGELGNGSTHRSSTPVRVTGIINARAISAGGSYACALLSGGTVKCWGRNAMGELGNGSTQDSSIPVRVRKISNATAISAASYSACARLSNGSVECWGANDHGLFGNGKMIDVSTTPVRVSGISNASAISVGFFRACAVLSGGTVACWGDNQEGELGNGTAATGNSGPVRVSGIRNATEVSVGDVHSCALLSSGKVKCWGLNSYGQLGDGSTKNRLTPVNATGLR